MNHRSIPLLRCALVGVLMLASVLVMSQPAGQSEVQRLREEIDRLRIELVQQHRELSFRNQALRDELRASQEEAQALLSQLLDAQQQLGRVTSGEELARVNVEKEALQAQLFERRAAQAQLEEQCEAERNLAKQENEALLNQLLDTQTQLQRQMRMIDADEDPENLRRQINALEAELRQLKSHGFAKQLDIHAGWLESDAGQIPVAVVTRANHSPAAVAQDIRTYFAARQMIPAPGTALQFNEAALPEISSESLLLRFVIGTDPAGRTVAKCLVQTATDKYLSDAQDTQSYPRVCNLLQAIFVEE